MGPPRLSRLMMRRTRGMGNYILHYDLLWTSYFPYCRYLHNGINQLHASFKVVSIQLDNTNQFSKPKNFTRFETPFEVSIVPHYTKSHTKCPLICIVSLAL